MTLVETVAKYAILVFRRPKSFFLMYGGCLVLAVSFAENQFSLRMVLVGVALVLLAGGLVGIFRERRTFERRLAYGRRQRRRKA